MIKWTTIALLTLLACACTTTGTLGGQFTQRTSDTYDLQVGGGNGHEEAEYSFHRGAYELCKQNNLGFEVKQKDWKYLSNGGSWIEGSIKCTGKIDDFLIKKYSNAPADLKIEKFEANPYSPGMTNSFKILPKTSTKP